MATKKRYLCIACSTIRRTVYVKPRRNKDGLYCPNCGSYEVTNKYRNFREAMSKF